MNHLVNFFLASDQPLLPGLILAKWALHAAWALLLASAMWACTAKVRLGWRWALTVVLAAVTLLPGTLSPAYWLATAFQCPSLMTQALCLAWIAQQSQFCRPTSGLALPGALTSSKPCAARCPCLGVAWLLTVTGACLGWILLVDLLAGWPVSLYAWGFGSAATALAGAVALLFWLLGGAQPATSLPALVIIVFVLTRLPTGNVWDALLDPWLWLALQLQLLRRAWRWRHA